MKKILSLLSMLMITVMAFATTDYKGQLDFAIKISSYSYPASIAEGTLSIKQYANGNYQVTAKDFNIPDVGNFGDVVCDGLPGTTDANGVTTINVTDCTAGLDDGLSWTDLSSTKLLVKFNNEKAYATFEGQYQVGVWRTVSYTFGTDDFGSTGGGTVTEEYAVNFDKGAKSTHSGRFLRSFSLQQTGKEKQTESVSALRAAYEDHTSKVFTVEAGSEVTASFNYSGEWMNGYVYIDRDNDGEFSYKEGQWDQAGTDLVAYSFYTTLPNPKVNDGNGYNSTGASVSGDARSNVNPPSFTAPTEPGTYRIRFKIDWNCILPGGSNDILSDGGGVWDATLNVVAAEPTVKEEKSFTDAISMVVGDMSEVAGQAQVTIKEMTDETISMTLAVVGQEGAEYTASGFTKTVDTEKNRTTYTGTLNIEDEDYDVTALVYTDGVEKLYMVAKGAEYNYVIGTNPDYVAPVTYKNTLKVVRGTDTKTYENAEVSVLAKGENKYAVTIPSFSDMDQNEGTIGKLTFEATGEEENGTLKLTATSAATTQEGGDGWDDYGFTASMDATVTGETLAGTFTVVYPDDVTNYTYTLYYGVEPPVAPEKPKDVTVVEKYQADGTGFSHTINVNWDKQKIVASIDFSNGGDDKDILAMTTGDSFTAFQTSTYRTMHWFCNQTAKQMSGFFAKDGAGNNNTGRFDVADCLAKFEISKAEGLKVNGEVKMTPDVLEDLLTGDPIIIGSGESPKFSKAYYNYIKVVSLDWKETTEPEVNELSNKTYTSNLRIFDGEERVVENAEAQVNIIKYYDESYKVTLKDVTLNENTQDLVFVGTTPEEAPTAEAAEPLTINAKSDEATTTFFGKQVNGTFEITEVSDDEIKMEFAIEGEGVLYEGEFNYEAKTPAAEPFCKENYVADGNGFEWEFAVDWDTQKVVMSIDPSTCTGNCEDVIGLGAVPTAWNNTLHLYRTRADKMLQGYFQVPGGNNNNTDKFAETVPFLVEVSKAQGFVVNDEVKIAASEMSYLFTLPTVKMGTGERNNDKSRATYNYVKVVDKDWTKDPETGINATTVAEGEFEVFSVDGVKLSKLQKGLNIVRSADGKVKKVLVK